MTRIKTGVIRRNAHKKILKLNKGCVGSHSRLFRVANQEYIRSLSNSYFGRKEKKRKLRHLWIKQINIASRRCKKSYSNFTFQLKINKIFLNRKVLAGLCVHDLPSFRSLINSL